MSNAASRQPCAMLHGQTPEQVVKNLVHDCMFASVQYPELAFRNLESKLIDMLCHLGIQPDEVQHG